MGEQTLTVDAKGLWLTPNPFSAPPGALSAAENVVIRRPGVVEPRRGQKPDATLNAPADAMGVFEGAVVLHNEDDEIEYRIDEDQMSQIGTGGYASPTGAPTRFVEAGGGLYWTTSAGLIRADALDSTAVSAGMPPGLEGSGTATGASGWLPTASVVGYRFVWGSRDGDGALLLGAPSGRILVTNSSGGSRDVSLTTPIPDGVTAGTHFLQVYRTVTTAASGDDPGEDMAQVLEAFPTAAQITAGSMTATDIASFASGAAAYFSPNTGSGLADAKEQPPLLTDAIAYKGYLFGVVQSYRQYIELSLLGLGAPAGLVNGDGVKIDAADDSWSEGFIASAAPEGTQLVGPPPIAAWAFTIGSGGTAAENIEATARSLVRVVNSKAPHLYAQYASAPSDLPGKVLISMRDAGEDTPFVRATVNGLAWVPSLKVFQDVGLVRVTNVVTGTTAGSHHVTTGQIVHITSTDPNFASGNFTVASTPTATTFTYAEVGIDATALGQEFSTTTEDVTMTQEASTGSWATSAFEEYDAWPPRFRYQVGGPNTRLDRMTAQGDALLYWTTDGLYRLTGNDEADFTLRPLDPTVKLVGAKTPVTLGNKCYALTNQGVVVVSELGVEKISTPMDAVFLPYYASTDDLKEATAEAAFGVAYEGENEYILFLPAPDAEPGDPADRAYVYNTQTGTWVGPWLFSWEGISTGAVGAAIVGPDNRLYIGAGDRLTRERKDRTLSDYQDADDAGIPMDVAYQIQTAKNPGALKQWTEVACLLEAPQPATMELYFTTEIDSNEEGGTISSQSNMAVRTYIPRNKSRSARLTVGMRHDTPEEKPVILGLSVVYNTNSTRVGR